MANIYMDTMNDLGYTNYIYSRYAYLVLTWSFTTQFKREINQGFPTMWNTAGGHYGAHSMVVNGYQRYLKKTRF